jgi:hypothetical protein
MSQIPHMSLTVVVLRCCRVATNWTSQGLTDSPLPYFPVRPKSSSHLTCKGQVSVDSHAITCYPCSASFSATIPPFVPQYSIELYREEVGGKEGIPEKDVQFLYLELVHILHRSTLCRPFLRTLQSSLAAYRYCSQNMKKIVVRVYLKSQQ